MKYDIFFSISQTPVDGRLPSEAEMFGNFFEQVEHADTLGFGVAWIAESHLSSQVQKGNARPVIPHWEGEVGLNTDLPQLAARVFARTRRIEVGSAVMNILCMGGPVAHAERIATFCGLHGLDPSERRRLHVGFASGRFDFMNEASGIGPRDPVEAVAWRALKGLVLKEATTIFLRLLRGDVLCSDEVPGTSLDRSVFRSDDDWRAVQDAAVERDGLATRPDSIEIPRRWVFENLKIIPQEWRRELLQLVIGSHDPDLQDYANTLLPVQVFNLSITAPEVIEATHARMRERYHPEGGPWERGFMPRTVFVFVNHEDGLTPAQRSSAARTEAEAALSAYWKALQGTIDPAKVSKAADNALVGNVEEVAAQVKERFHPDDRLMLWFDFFNHDSARVMRNMSAFMNHVRPLVEQA
jgi:alkanesulfonate monooxygenase SsuD/methylene tetrahydromethanopterin reductase-like flavin-dependent oxidoreductase (luciferase family)